MMPSATALECTAATAMAAIRVGVPIERLVGTSGAMSSGLACEPRLGMSFVVGQVTTFSY